MEFLDGAATWFRNARIVTADRVFIGCLKVEDGRIEEIGEDRSPAPGIDFQGDYLLPGLIELHTDHLESHYVPRPAVTWHAGSAVLAYDAQIAAAGITTVFDSFRVGVDEFELGRRSLATRSRRSPRRCAGRRTRAYCAPTISPTCAARFRRSMSSTPSTRCSRRIQRSSSRSWTTRLGSANSVTSGNTSPTTPASRDGPRPISRRWRGSARRSARRERSKTGRASWKSPEREASRLPATMTRRRRRSPSPIATG